MPKRILCIIFVVVLSATGCASRRYRVIPNSPDAPRFVVIPFDHSSAQRAYADLIEQELMSFGFVVYAPGLGERDIEIGETGTDLPSRIGELTSGNREGPATHVVQSYVQSNGRGSGLVFTDARLKIWDVQSRRVLTSFPVKPHAERHYIYKALKAQGMPVEQY